SLMHPGGLPGWYDPRIPAQTALPASSMLTFLPPTARGVAALVMLVVNTLFWCLLLFLLALVKLALPLPAVRAAIDPVLNGIATRWIAGNSGWMRLTQRAQWDVAGLDG